MLALVVSFVNCWVGEPIWRVDVKDSAGSFIVDADLMLGWKFAIHNKFWIHKTIPDNVWK